MQTNPAQPASRILTFTAQRPTKRPIIEIRAHALARAEMGWTRNRATHETLELLEMSGLVVLEMSELRQAQRPDSDRMHVVWAGSRWTLTPTGHAELARLRRILPDISSEEIASWEPSAVLRSERVSSGIYSVQLANKARATVAKADQVQSGVARRGWYWIDRRGGVEGFKTKGDAIESFRRYRG